MNQLQTPQPQEKLVWFDHLPGHPNKQLPERPSDDDVRKLIGPANSNCPLNRILVSEDNKGNMDTLRKFAFTCMKRYDRSARGCNFGIYCPPGQGKTFIVKRFAETLGLPFVAVQSPMLDSTHHLFQLMCDECRKKGIPVVPFKGPIADFTLPPMIVFFDEAHELKKDLMKGGLLNAMEPDDALMVVKAPGTRSEQVVVDTRDVCWVAATTDRGDLFDAFESRLPTPINWHPASIDELPLIIKAGLDAKRAAGETPFTAPLEVCRLIANYQRVPRLAIHGFGVKVIQHKDYDPKCSWDEACEVVARNIGLDKGGLTEKQVRILSALGQRPIAQGRMGDICQCRLKEVLQYELPALQQYHNGGPYVVSVSGRGLAITEAGLKQLEDRGISHNGNKVTAEYFESRR